MCDEAERAEERRGRNSADKRWREQSRMAEKKKGIAPEPGRKGSRRRKIENSFFSPTKMALHGYIYANKLSFSSVRPSRKAKKSSDPMVDGTFARTNSRTVRDWVHNSSEPMDQRLVGEDNETV